MPSDGSEQIDSMRKFPHLFPNLDAYQTVDSESECRVIVEGTLEWEEIIGEQRDFRTKSRC